MRIHIRCYEVEYTILPDSLHTPVDVQHAAFQRGQDAALGMHGGRLRSQITAKDVVTGLPVIYDQMADADAAGVGDVEATIQSVPTPLPATSRKYPKSEHK